MHANRAGHSGTKTVASALGNEAVFLLHPPKRTNQSEMSHLAPPPGKEDHNNPCSPVISNLTQENPKVILYPTNLLIQVLLQDAVDLMLVFGFQFFDEEQDLPPLCSAEGQRLHLQPLRQVR